MKQSNNQRHSRDACSDGSVKKSMNEQKHECKTGYVDHCIIELKHDWACAARRRNLEAFEGTASILV